MKRILEDSFYNLFAAADEFLVSVRTKHNMKYTDKFDCPYMNALEEALLEVNEERRQ